MTFVLSRKETLKFWRFFFSKNGGSKCQHVASYIFINTISNLGNCMKMTMLFPPDNIDVSENLSMNWESLRIPIWQFDIWQNSNIILEDSGAHLNLMNPLIAVYQSQTSNLDYWYLRQMYPPPAYTLDDIFSRSVREVRGLTATLGKGFGSHNKDRKYMEKDKDNDR